MILLVPQKRKACSVHFTLKICFSQVSDSELMAMFLSFQMTISLATAAVVWAILKSASGLDPSSDTIASNI